MVFKVILFFFPVLKLPFPFFLFFFFFGRWQMCLCFLPFPSRLIQMAAENAARWKISPGHKWPFWGSVACHQSERPKNSIWCLCLQCVLSLHHTTVAFLQVRWSYAWLRCIVYGDICLSRWSSGIFGGHEINCSREKKNIGATDE